MKYRIMDFSGRRLPETFPYSALVGATLDTNLRQFTEAFGVFSPAVLVVDIGSGMCWLLLVTLHLELCSSTSISVAIPQVQFVVRLLRLLLKPVAIPQVQSLVKVYMPVVVSGAVGQTVQNTVENLQSQFWDKVFMRVVVSGADGQTVRTPVEIPQVPFLDKLFMPAVVSGAVGQTAQKTVDFLQLLLLMLGSTVDTLCLSLRVGLVACGIREIGIFLGDHFWIYSRIQRYLV